MGAGGFERSVFVNAPFDEDFAYMLQAICFCVADLGFLPRLAPENGDNSVPRLERIQGIIETSRFGIHDLSRCRAQEPHEYARMNMPFELGLDLGAARYGASNLPPKQLLVLEWEQYSAHRALSDIAGWDIEFHRGDFQTVIRKVSRWLIRQACLSGDSSPPPSVIEHHYQDFQEWFFRRELLRGSSEQDIMTYETIHVVDAMVEWVQAGRPLS